MKEPKFLHVLVGISSVLTLREATFLVKTGAEWSVFTILGLILISFTIFFVLKQKPIWTAYCYIIYLVTSLLACFTALRGVYQGDEAGFFTALFSFLKYNTLLIICFLISITIIMTIVITIGLHSEKRNLEEESS